MNKVSETTLIFGAIAEREVHFYIATARSLQKRDPNLKCIFISFFEPGNKLITDAGYEVYSPYDYLRNSAVKLESWSTQKIESDYKTWPLKELLQHEKLTFGLKTDVEVEEKFSRFFQVCEMMLTEIETKHPSSQKIIIQELAGFVAPLSLFYVGLKRKWVHYFLEPSYFRGRLFFDRDNLNCVVPAGREMTAAEIETARGKVLDYIQGAARTKAVVAPKKDSHHFRDMGFVKLVNSENFRKLTKKIYYKYVLNQTQEFEYIFNHVRNNLRMFVNRKRNSNRYTQLSEIPQGTPVIYFPFHVQLDFALTIRSPKWLDQLGLVEKALEVLPEGAILMTKEHPASIGCLDQTRLEKVLKNKKFRLMHPNVNSYDIFEKSCGVLTINSKVGAEALSSGLPVQTYGSAFYTDQGYAVQFKDWSETASLFRQWIQNAPHLERTADKAWIDFLIRGWYFSHALELYDLTPANVDVFAEAILTEKSRIYEHLS